MSKNIKKNSILQNLFVIGRGTVFSVIIAAISLPIITRIINPDDYGKMGIYSTYASISLMVLCVGLDQAFVRFYYRKDENSYKKSLLKFCLGLPVALTLICSVIVIFISKTMPLFFHFDMSVMILLCVYTLVNIINRFSQLSLRLTYKSKEYAFSNIITKVVYLITVILLVKFSLINHFYVLIIATLLSVILTCIYSIKSGNVLWSFNDSYSLDNKRELIVYGAPFILSLGLTTLFQAIDKLTLEAYCTYTDVAIYTSAISIVAVLEIAQTTFNTLWSPLQIEHYESDPHDKAFIQKANRYVTVLMFAVGVCLIFVKDAAVLILGEKYRDASQVLPFLVFNPIMYTISETTHGGIEFSKKSYLNIVISAIVCVTNLCGNLLLVPFFGCKGAALSTGVSYILFFYLRTFFSQRNYKVDYKLWKFNLLTIATFIYAFFNTFYPSFVMSAIFFIIIIVLMVFLYKQTIIEMIDIVKAELQKLKVKQNG